MKRIDSILPHVFHDRLSLLIPPLNLEQVEASFWRKKPTTIRVNTLKTSPAAIEDLLRRHSIRFLKPDWYPLACILPDTPVRTLTDLPEHAAGHFYIQNLSSMVPALVLDPRPGERVLDIAAAPGSKTTQMAAMMENEGTIVANDLSRIRIMRLEANLAQQGVTCADVSNIPAQQMWKEYPEFFNKVLADVPCSMEGRIYYDDPKSYRDWSLKRIRQLGEMQKWILRSAVSSAKPGGIIVYSTCTLAPEENEAVVDWIIGKENGAIVPERIELEQLGTQEGIAAWNGKAYRSGIGMCLRILPSDSMEGFFVAKLRKIASTVPPNVPTGGSR